MYRLDLAGLHLNISNPSGMGLTAKPSRQAVRVFCCAIFGTLLLAGLAHRSERVHVTTEGVYHFLTHGRPPGSTSWVSTGPISQRSFPDPYAQHQYTRLHAAVQSQEDTFRNGTGRFVSVLLSIEGTVLLASWYRGPVSWCVC